MLEKQRQGACQVLITGGAGFIGSHLAEYLLNRDYQVIIVDSLERGRREDVPVQAAFHQVDILSAEFAGLIRSKRPDVIVHLAAQMEVQKSIADPLFDANINVVGTVNLVDSAMKAGTKAVIFASSGGAIYGNADKIPTTETASLRPTTPYGVSKLCAEKYLSWAMRSSNMRTVSLRFGNVYGPRQTNAGESGVASIFATEMIRKKSPVIYGSGEQSRDFIDVFSVCAAIELSMRNQQAHGPMNIATGVATSVLELAKVLKKLTGFGGHPQFRPAMPDEVHTSCLSNCVAERTLGWRPLGTLEEGLVKLVLWAEKQHVLERAPEQILKKTHGRTRRSTRTPVLSRSLSSPE